MNISPLVKKVDIVCCSLALVAVVTFLIWITLPVVGDGLSSADDAILAHAAKSLAIGRGYGWTKTPNEFSPFDPGAISTGPTMILPLALLIRVFGPIDQMPGALTLVMFLVQLVIAAFLLCRRFGWTATCGFFAAFLWLLMLASANHWFFGVFIGEAVAFGFMLIGVICIAEPMPQRWLVGAGLCFGLAFLTKEIALFAIAGVVGTWFVVNVCHRATRTTLVRRAAILVLAVLALAMLFEVVKLATLGVARYRTLLEQASNARAYQGVGSGNFAERSALFWKFFSQSYLSPGLFIGLMVGCSIILGLCWRYPGKSSHYTKRFILFAWAAVGAYFLYILLIAPVWPRYFWIGIALMLAAISAPILQVGSVLRLALITTIFISTLAFGLHRQTLATRFWASQSPAAAERADVVKVLDNHSDLPYAGQFWQCIFDILFLRRDEGVWAYEPNVVKLRGQVFIAIMNNVFSAKNSSFVKSVESACEPLTPDAKVIAAYRCGQEFWATYRF